MAQIHIDTLRKLRGKLVEQRRAMALRQSSSSQSESPEHMVNLQKAIETIDLVIVEEQQMLLDEEETDQSDE